MENKTINRLFWIIAAAVSLIAVGSFLWSFLALWELAAANSAQPALGWVWPGIVDLSMIIYTGAILTAQVQRRPAKLPITLTIFYALVTVTGNVLHAPPTPLGWFVAILPPLSLIFGTEMLRSMGHHIIERAGAVATLSELAELQTASVTARAEAERQIADLTTRRDAIRIELEALRKEKRRETTTAPAETSPDVYQAARAILAERGAEISGSELGRLLSKSESLGRRLKRELTEAAEGGSAPATLEPASDSSGGAFERIVNAALEDGKPGVADIITTAKRGWDRINGNGHAPEEVI